MALAALILGVIAVNGAWLGADARLPDADDGKHLISSFRMYEGLAAGHPRTPLYLDTGYPPLVYLVGALGVLVGGFARESAIASENIVFVPVLAAGCYWTGRLAYDRLTGVLAAVFAFAAPMVISLFHAMMLDTPQAALVAVTVALVMASGRFERVGVSALGGVAFGLGALTKETFVLFLVGFLAVALIRGCWRNWRGMLAFVVVAAVIAAPWYVENVVALASETGGFAGGAPLIWYGDVPYPERWSVANFTWYAWAVVNEMLYLPLTLFVLVGVVFAVRRAVRPTERTWEPELLAGLVTSYLAVSLLRLDDPRYLLPWLVYAAVIGTAWVAALPRRGRLVAGVALGALLVANTAGQTLDLGSRVQISLWDPSTSPIAERTLTVYKPDGYGVGEPLRDGATVGRLLRAARADGARRVGIDTSSVTASGLHVNGFAAEAWIAGLDVAGYDQTARLGRQDVYLTATPGASAGACAEVNGAGVLLSLGAPPGNGGRPSCP